MQIIGSTWGKSTSGGQTVRVRHAMTESPASAPSSFWARRSSPDATPAAKPNRFGRTPVLIFFAFEIICCTFLQKFAIPITINLGKSSTSLGSVEVALPLTYIALGILFLFRAPRVDPVRLALMLMFFFLAFISTLLLNSTYSASSILLIIALTMATLFEIEVSPNTYKSCLKIYLNIMILVGLIVTLQWLIQIFFTWRLWPNLDRLVPIDYLYTGYVYLQGVTANSRYMKPNGIFFLEVSYISQFTAMALAIELIYFRRLARLVFYAVVLLESFAGTGLLLLALGAPALLMRMSWKSILMVALLLAASVAVAYQIHWYEQVQHRFTEYQHVESSSGARFVEPFNKLIEVVVRKNSLLTGEGPGNIEKQFERGGYWWPLTKASDEYGLLAGLCYVLYAGYMLFGRAPSKRLGLLLFIIFNIMGGFGIVVYAIYFYVLGGFMRIRTSGG